MTEINKDNLNKKTRLGRGLGSLLGEPSVVGSGANQGADLLGTNNLTTQKDSVSTQKNIQMNTHVNNQLNSQVSNKPTGNQINATNVIGSVAGSLNAAPLQEIPVDQRIWKIGIDKLKPSAFQPRTHFDKDKLNELAQSIKESGLLQPIIARKSGVGFEIIAGERRWRAAQLAGLHEVPVLIKTYDDKKTLELAIIENVQREDLNPIEEAEAYSRLMDEFQLTQQQVAEKVGKDRATVANALRLLVLPRPVREKLVAGLISAGHAKVLLGLSDEQKIIKLAGQIESQGLSVRKLEKLVNAAKLEKAELAGTDPLASKAFVRDRLIKDLEEKLQKKLGTKITIESNSEGKGKIQIAFYSDDQLNSILDRML